MSIILMPLRRPLQQQLPIMATGGIWILCLLLTAWLVSGWFWSWIAPRNVISVQESIVLDPLLASQNIASRHLMGQQGGELLAQNSDVLRRFRLIGTMTGTVNKKGFAILVEEGQTPIAIVEDEEFLPNMVLVKVLPKQAQIRHDGSIETLELVSQPGDDVVLNDTSSQGDNNVIENTNVSPPVQNYRRAIK